VQPVVAQQDRPLRRTQFAGVSHELFRVGQADRRALVRGAVVIRQPVTELDEHLPVLDLEADRVAPSTRRQRCCAVEEFTSIGDHLVATDAVVAGALLGTVRLADDVGAVERVVERTPARVGGVEREAGIEHRHHQLGAGGRGDLVVDVGRRDREVTRIGFQVADLGEELLVLGGVVRTDGPLAVPFVELGLQFVAARQQFLVAWSQVGDDLVDPRPETVRVEVGTGQRLIGDEVVECAGHAQVSHRHAICHRLPPRPYFTRATRHAAVDPAYPWVTPANPACTDAAASSASAVRSSSHRAASVARSGAARSAMSCCARTYSARPAGVSIAMASNP